jgi:hypothetical protein
MHILLNNGSYLRPTFVKTDNHLPIKQYRAAQYANSQLTFIRDNMKSDSSKLKTKQKALSINMSARSQNV